MSRRVLHPAAIAALIAGAYLAGAAAQPLRWEEPRRALVALEMIQRGDFVVPRLLGEAYRNKPPLQNWLIALFAAGDARRLDALAVRLPTLLALLGIAALLGRLGVRDGGGPHAYPPLVFTTLGIVVQYGRTGETDVLFAFFVWAAWATFEAGRRRGAPYLQWAAPQALLAAGTLTKGLAPLFFYPAALWLAWRRPRLARFRLAPFAVGLAAFLAIGAAWVVPYALRAPVDRLGVGLARQATSRLAPESVLDLARHLALYPLSMLGAALPWSLLVPALLVRGVRERARGLLADPYRALAATVLAWGLLLFLFVPGTRPRYLMPVLPAAAVLAAALLDRLRPVEVSRRTVLAVAAPTAAAWGAGAVLAAGAWGLAWLGAGAVALGAALAARGRALLGALTALALLHALFHAGIREPRRAARDRTAAVAGAALAEAAPDLPAAVAAGLDRRVVWAFAERRGRVPARRPPPGPHLRLGRAADAPPGAARLAEAAGYAVWRVP